MQPLLHSELIATYVRDAERRRIARTPALESGEPTRLRIGRHRHGSGTRSVA
jgi:hypothetical protein